MLVDAARRQKLSRIRAQVSTLVARPKGFFIQYEYVASVQPPSGYPALKALFLETDFSPFLDDIASCSADFETFGAASTDPVWNSNMFAPLDGAATFALVRRKSPGRVIEIGSGDSTRFIAKAAVGQNTRVTCIDPQPRRSLEGLPVEFLKRPLRESDADLVAELEAGDVLFIDSSHILLPGTDVDILFNLCFPRLKPGVLVHVHDIWLPDDYPPSWRARNWNEQNALAGWLLAGAFEPLYAGAYLVKHQPQLLRDRLAGMSLLEPHDSGSVWLRRRSGR